MRRFLNYGANKVLVAMSEWGSIEIEALAKLVRDWASLDARELVTHLITPHVSAETILSNDNGYAISLAKTLLLYDEPQRAAEIAASLRREDLLMTIMDNMAAISTLREYLDLTGITWNDCPSDAYRVLRNAAVTGDVEWMKILISFLKLPVGCIDLNYFEWAATARTKETQECFDCVRASQEPRAKNAADA